MSDSNNPYHVPRADDDNPHLKPLLAKLRPFQREAYEFATSGKTYQRQWNNSNTACPPKGKSKNNSKRSKQPEDTGEDAFSYDPQYLGKGRILLADEMGLGKTVSSLAIMTHYIHEWPLLVLCPASLRHTWPSEIERFLPTISPQELHVVQGFDDTAWVKRRRQLKIVIATYSLLQTRSAVAHILQDFNFECVICDESHNLKERTSQRCKLAFPILQNAKRLVLLSGTPALARPVELWAQAYCLAPDLFGKYTPYTKEHCNARRGRFGWDVSGLSNGEQLHKKLKQIMVRRLKANVLQELPPKQRSMVPIKLDSKSERDCRELMEDLKETRLCVSEMVGDDARSANFEARKLLMQAYQQSGIAKASAVANYLVDWLDGSGTQKILVFAHHKQVLDTLEQVIAKKYKGVGHMRIDGSVDSKERAVRVKKFQTNARTRVALLSMTAAGVGLTLTAASSVLFAELHWTPGVLAQAEDRCHRIGQVNAVNVMYCVCKDTELSVDMSLWAMLGRKIGTLGKVIDGDRNASLQANDATNNATGESVEEGLTRFFAETADETTTNKTKAIPVKGSIMSFFKPAAAPAAAATSNEKEVISVPKSTTKQAATPRAALPPPTKLSARKLQPGPVEWACDACTFHNVKIPSRTGWLACNMCGSAYTQVATEQSKKRRPVTPKEKQQKPIVVDESRLKTTAISKEQDVVVLDEEDRKPTAKSVEIITLDEDSRSSNIITPAKIKEQKFLKFSVSKNSGRVTIHDGTTGERFPYNFDIGQAISDETSDQLLQAEVSRSNNSRVRLDFDDSGIKQLLGPVVKDFRLSGKITGRGDEKKCRQEVKDFISNYFGLREVEKKTLKDSGKPFSGSNLKQSVSKLMTASMTQSTERYSGGAKERAMENLKEGAVTAKDQAVLDGKACAWCAGNLSQAAQKEGVESTYCSQKCAEEGRLQRGGMFASTRVRAQVFGLEGGVCRKCGIDAHALYTRISALEPPERLNALINANWSLPKSGPAMERLLQNPKEGDFWQADHIVAVAEGGGGCSLDNLQTLCTPCHQNETSKLRARLKLGSTKPGEKSDGKRKQMDIRSAFFGVKSSKKAKS